MKPLGPALVLSVFASDVCAALTSCTADTFKTLLPSGAVLETISVVTNGSSYGEGAADIGFPGNATGLPELCSLTVNVTSSPTSSYRFGLFLPTQWNSRFIAVGNGGFAGGVNWIDMGSRVLYGFATMSTDTGHNSTAGDLSWANGNDERKIDFGWRAMHGSVELAKQLTKAYYAHNISYSYYSGCSTGGRQGLKEAQVSPDSFDGILVGAPAWWTSHLQPWTTWLGAQNLPSNATNHIPTRLFPLIQSNIMQQCDLADGVPDGIISAPDACAVFPGSLQCGGSLDQTDQNLNETTCLIADQIRTVQSIYQNYYSEGTFVFPGLKVGSEWQWDVLLGGDSPSPLGWAYIRDMLLNDPKWTWDQFNGTLVWMADAEDPGNCSATGYNMTAFRDRGGKALMYHGLADGLIATGSSPYFYRQVVQAVENGSVSSTRGWFRYFDIPGMGHCANTGVDAPWYIAGGSQAGGLESAPGESAYSVPGFEDARHDSLLALMAWVENGTAVDELVATTWKNQSIPSSGVYRQRPLCPYPQTAQWDTKGDEKLVTSWNCTTYDPSKDDNDGDENGGNGNFGNGN